MSQRRMFSPKITSTDSFLDMPVSARELYFQLGMNADDDGFITPKGIMKMIGASNDDLKVLVAKNFVIPFYSGVIVITAWKINNLVRKDWYRETIYKKEKKLLNTDENGSYKLVNESLTNRQRRLGKVRLGKVRLLSVANATWNASNEINKLLTDKNDYIRIIGTFMKIKGLLPANRQQLQSIISRNVRPAKQLCGYSLERVEEVIKWLIKNSDFKWTLESVSKFIDEDLKQINKARVEDIQIPEYAKSWQKNNE